VATYHTLFVLASVKVGTVVSNVSPDLGASSPTKYLMTAPDDGFVTFTTMFVALPSYTL